MDTNINIWIAIGLILLTALVQSLASFSVKKIEASRKKSKEVLAKEEKFKTYKNYAIEFLTTCTSAYKDEEFIFLNKPYKLNELKIALIKTIPDFKLKILLASPEQLIPIYALGFISKLYLLSEKDTWLLRNLLDSMSLGKTWFFIDQALEQYSDKHENIANLSFNYFSVQDKNKNILFLCTNYCNIMLTEKTNKEYLELLLKKLEDNEFDDRIKKAIKQWESNNQNHIT